MKLEPLVAAKAKENLKTSTGGVNPQPLAMLPKAAPAVSTRAEIAKASDVKERTLAKVKVIAERGTEEVKQKLRDNHPGTSINREYKAIVHPPHFAVSEVGNTRRFFLLLPDVVESLDNSGKFARVDPG